jgi:hypothetical protein
MDLSFFLLASLLIATSLATASTIYKTGVAVVAPVL